MKHFVEFSNPGDILEIVELHAAIFSEIGMTIENSMPLFESAAGKIAIIKEEGDIIAYAHWEEHQSYAYLSWIGVSPLHRHKGHAKALLNFVINSCRKADCAAIGLDSRNRFKSAMGLYLKNDFDIIGTFLQTDGELMIRFRKSLAIP